MKINFLVNEIAGGWEPTDIRLGGTERGVVEWAECLADLGHKVDVYHNKRTHALYAGEYYPYLGKNYKKNNGWAFFKKREDYFVFGELADITINVKSHEVPPIGSTIYYTNDVDADRQDLSAYGAVIHISQWAKDHIPVNNPNVFVVPHGIDPIKPGEKVPKQCLYASSPDRGLDTLLRVWPEVHAKHPDATLIVTYGVEGLDLPGVTALGSVDETTMNHLYATSDVWCHPASGGELQCIAGAKAQSAGCWPVIIPVMALQETVKYGTFSTPETYAEDLIAALSGHPKSEPYKPLTIEESTNKLMDVVQFTLDKGK